MTRDLPEQVYRLGERVEFLDANFDAWPEGIVYEARLMAGGWIGYGVVTDNGHSLDRLEPERLRPLSAVARLGEIVGG